MNNDQMTGYERIKKHREESLDSELQRLENLTEEHPGKSHFISQESYKMGIEYAIREIEATENLMVKAHNELPYANPKEAEREHKNLMNVLGCLKYSLQKRYKWEP